MLRYITGFYPLGGRGWIATSAFGFISTDTTDFHDLKLKFFHYKLRRPI